MFQFPTFVGDVLSGESLNRARSEYVLLTLRDRWALYQRENGDYNRILSPPVNFYFVDPNKKIMAVVAQLQIFILNQPDD